MVLNAYSSKPLGHNRRINISQISDIQLLEIVKLLSSEKKNSFSSPKINCSEMIDWSMFFSYIFCVHCKAYLLFSGNE